MTDQDYIKAAVELADGWSLDDNFVLYGNLRFCFDGGCEYQDHTHRQIALDALAAQLVRQADKLKDVDFQSDINRNAIIHIPNMPIAYLEDGPDRTMNTIKTIVDSGVLK